MGFARESTATQVSNGALERQRQSLVSYVRSAGLKLKGLVYGHEPGKLSQPRPHLTHAIALARFHKAVIVAPDLSRLLRPEAFDPIRNRLAAPTPDEIAALLVLMDGVPLVATVVDPSLPQAVVHSLNTKRGMRAGGDSGGRPSPIKDYRLAEQLMREWAEGLPQSEIAKRHGLSKDAVWRLIKRLGTGPSRKGTP